MEQNKDQSGAAVRGEAVAKCTVPPIGWRCTRIAGHEGPCAAYPIDEAAEKYEAEMLEVIDQRDKYHDMADQLAAQIAAMTEVDIGEHSSANEPWRNALIAGDEFIAAKFKAFCNGPVSARAADAPSEPSVKMLSGALNHARDTLRFYAEQEHFVRHQPDSWDAVSGEPQSLYEDASNTATVEDGTLAKNTLNDIAGVEAYASVAADALDSQPTVSDGWISVKDRLPELGQTVLAVNNEYGQRESKFDRWSQGSINRANYGEEAGYFNWQEPMNNWGSSWKPTHWMPLPPAPASSQPTDVGVRK